MSAIFGDYLADLLREYEFTQQALCAWIVENQISYSHRSKPRFSTPSAVKEHLRTLRADQSPAVDYPLIFDIANFFEQKGKPWVAARLRHIYLHQSHDIGRLNKLYESADMHSEGVEWLIFPEPDQAATRLHFQKWRIQLFDGNRELLRDSLEFFHQYCNSYVHSPIRQMVAVDLARIAITHAEFPQAYVICSIYEQQWLGTQSKTLGVAVRDAIPYKIVLLDAYNYLRALQIKASAASYIFYYAPFVASHHLFTHAKKTLIRHKGLFKAQEDVYAALLIQWETRWMRMLARAYISMPEYPKVIACIKRLFSAGSGADRKRILQESKVLLTDDELLKFDLTRRLAKSLDALDRVLDAYPKWRSYEHIEPFLVIDTKTRAQALVSFDDSDLSKAYRLLAESATFIKVREVGSTDVPASLRQYRNCTTKAYCDIRKFLLSQSEVDCGVAVDSIKLVLKSADAILHRQIRFTVDNLTTHLLYSREGNIDVVIKDCDTTAIKRQLRLLENRARDVAGLMFTVNTGHQEHISCLSQANWFSRKIKPDIDNLEVATPN